MRKSRKKINESRKTRKIRNEKGLTRAERRKGMKIDGSRMTKNMNKRGHA